MAERHPFHFSGPDRSGSGTGRANTAAPRSGWKPAAGVALLALMLAGCGGVPRQSFSESPDYAALASVVTPDKALILPSPGGPAVMNIVQKTNTNSITQTVFLANDSRSPGENQMTVTLWGPVGRDGWSVEFNPQRPTQNSIYKEMQAALPGVPMHFSSYYVQNKYGPFGYAIGVPASGGLCLYGWQLIKAKPQDFFAPNLKRGAIGVRVRVCQANVTEAQLLQIMYDYTITGYFPPGVWNPFGDLPPVDPTIGTLNNPRMPVGREGLGSPVVGDVPMNGEVQGAIGRTRTATRARPRRTATQVVNPLLVQPLPTTTRPDVGYPVVPPPPGANITPMPSAATPESFSSAFPAQRATAAPAAGVRPAAVPVQTMPAMQTMPRVVAPQVTPGYSTVPATTAAPSAVRAPSYPTAYPGTYPTTTPSMGTAATVPAPPAMQTSPTTVMPSTNLQNPYNQ